MILIKVSIKYELFIKDWPKKGHNLFSYFLISKSSENILFFYLHFTWLVELPKNFEKMAILKKLESWFPSEVSKLTSVRNKLNLSMIDSWNKNCLLYKSRSWRSKYHLQTTLSEINNYYREIFVKINFFHAWKCIISGVKYQSKFWHLRRKSAVVS
jgi:hypothetical protein